jgi:hypothetical protein
MSDDLSHNQFVTYSSSSPKANDFTLGPSGMEGAVCGSWFIALYLKLVLDLIIALRNQPAAYIIDKRTKRIEIDFKEDIKHIYLKI